MTILSDLVNCQNKPKEQLYFFTNSLKTNLTPKEVITLTGILLRLVHQSAQKKSCKALNQHPLLQALLKHVLQILPFPCAQNKAQFIQMLLQAYYLEQNLETKKQEILTNKVLFAQIELDLKHQEIENACALKMAGQDKQKLSYFKTKYKIAKKALKLTQQDALQVLSHLTTLKQNIKSELRQADLMWMILLAPLFDECKNSGNPHDKSLFYAQIIHLIIKQAVLNKACSKNALPIVQNYLKKLISSSPDKIFNSLIIRLQEAMASEKLVYLNQDTLDRIKALYEKSTLPDQATEAYAEIASHLPRKKFITLIKEFFWSPYLVKRNALYQQ